MILKFIRYVDFPQDLDDCWLWMGATIRGGYGKMRYAGRFYLAHRIAWRLYRGTIAQVVGQECGVTSCVNPQHLWTGTERRRKKR